MKKSEVDTWRLMDTAPKDGTEILAGGPYEEIGVVAFDSPSDTWFYTVDGDTAIDYQTDCSTLYKEMSVPQYWMPIPKKPENWDA